MRRTAWIWLVGAIAWLVDGMIAVRLHSPAHAELALLMSALFLVAWLFYRQQKR